MVTDSNGRYYWGIDVPGLTADQAAALVVVVGDTFPDLQGLPVDPAEFLTLSMDRATVEIVCAGLVQLESSDGARALLDEFNDWLSWSKSGLDQRA